MGMLRMAGVLEIWVPHRSDNTPPPSLRRTHADQTIHPKKASPPGECHGLVIIAARVRHTVQECSAEGFLKLNLSAEYTAIRVP